MIGQVCEGSRNCQKIKEIARTIEHSDWLIVLSLSAFQFFSMKMPYVYETSFHFLISTKIEIPWRSIWNFFSSLVIVREQRIWIQLVNQIKKTKELFDVYCYKILGYFFFYFMHKVYFFSTGYKSDALSLCLGHQWRQQCRYKRILPLHLFWWRRY